MKKELSDREVLEHCDYSLDTMTKEELAAALANEIRDLWSVSNHCSQIYMWVTNGRVSNPQTLSREVIAIAEDIRVQEIAELVEEEVIARLSDDSPSATQNEVLRKVLHERMRQDRLFGKSPRNLKPTAWLPILVEEVGEVAKAIVEGQSPDYAQELVEVAATAVEALEDYYGGQADLQLEDVCPSIQYDKTPKVG